MNCPKCNNLLDPSTKICPSCGADISKMNSTESNGYVKVFESSNLGITAIIKSILSDADIDFLIKGDHMQGLLGAQFNFGFGAEIGKVVFFVQQKDADVAIELLKEINP
ncbi:MAG: hypothetical protein K9N07_02205 [Candidatus Cloacimonetes bacterium]|nr:hypothetical protein [Candidatus Cloacimonadota bacterium]